MYSLKSSEPPLLLSSVFLFLYFTLIKQFLEKGFNYKSRLLEKGTELLELSYLLTTQFVYSHFTFHDWLLSDWVYTCTLAHVNVCRYKSNLLLLCYVILHSCLMMLMLDAIFFCWILPLPHMAISVWVLQLHNPCVSSMTAHSCVVMFGMNEVYLYGLTQIYPGGNLHLVFAWSDALQFLLLHPQTLFRGWPAFGKGYSCPG